MSLTNTVLASWNELDAEAASAAILPCNGSRAWARGLAALRPFHTPEDLFAASDRVWRTLPDCDWQQAFETHPRIGERKANAAPAMSPAEAQSLDWSSAEQSVANPDSATQAELAAANREYEAKFGGIFIICATGKTAAEMLAVLRQRLGNDAAAEMREAAEQQRQITQLRLRKWLVVP